jgi:hypothetical protein
MFGTFTTYELRTLESDTDYNIYYQNHQIDIEVQSKWQINIIH